MTIYDGEWFQVSLFKNAILEIKDYSNKTNNTPKMIELGCAEGEYSKLFYDSFEGKCVNICTDILPRQIEKSRTLVPTATFIHGYSGAAVHFQEVREDNHGAQKIEMDSLINESNLTNILHMDIQGAESLVIEELHTKNLFEYIDFMFISLHGTWGDVVKYIPNYYQQVFAHPTEGSYGDGLMVIKNNSFKQRGYI